MQWKELLSELTTGEGCMSQTAVAQAVGLTQPSISDLANGNSREPGFLAGRKLVGLWAKRRGNRALERAVIEPNTKPEKVA